MEQMNELKHQMIYKYTFPNGKMYIGKTSKTLLERQGVDWTGYKECPAVFNAINYYKPENIKQEILVEGMMTDTQINELERFYIALYKTNCNRYRNPQYGYNLTDGGDGSSGPRPHFVGRNNHRSKSVYCIETDTHYDTATEASIATSISVTQICACCRGDAYVCGVNKDNPNGFHWVWSIDAYDEKIQEVLSKNRFQHLCKPVYCIELDKYFESIKCAEEELHITGITQALHHTYCSAGKHPFTNKPLHWLWKEDVSDENIQRVLCIPKIIHKGTEVYCIELDKAFVSVSVPSRALGISRKTIMSCINGEVDYAGINPYNGQPLHWILLSQCKNKDNIEVLTQFETDKFERKIYCVELNMYFNGTRDASNYVRISRNTLKACLRGDRPTAGSHPETGELLHWIYTYNENYFKKDG